MTKLLWLLILLFQPLSLIYGNSSDDEEKKGSGGTRTGDKTKVDFEETSIGGERKNPMGSLINQTKSSSDNDDDLLKLRENWHEEMQDSPQNINSKKSKDQ